MDLNEMPLDLLIVEPDPELGKVIASPFERNGYVATIVTDVLEVGEVLESGKRFAFAIVDRAFVEGMESWLLTRIGRERVIFTSAWGAREVTQEFERPCFQKPFSPLDLFRMVAGMVSAEELRCVRKEASRASEEIIVGMRSSATRSIRLLATALETCKGCHRRCPGPSNCEDIQVILEEGTGQEACPTGATSRIPFGKSSLRGGIAPSTLDRMCEQPLP